MFLPLTPSLLTKEDHYIDECYGSEDRGVLDSNAQTLYYDAVKSVTV